MTHFRFRHKQLGGHVHVRIFVGRDEDHLGLSGTLVFREDNKDKEWTAFYRAIDPWIDKTTTVDFVDEGLKE